MMREYRQCTATGHARPRLCPVAVVGLALGAMMVVDRPSDAARLAHLTQPIWEYLAVSDSARAADVIFVFGCRDLAVPARAAVLFHEGHASRSLVTGSFGRMTRGVFDKAEALVFKDHLVQAGVPEASIITEPEAVNTLENVQFGMAALVRQGVRPRSALLVAKGFVMRRCVATFAQQFNDVRVRACPPAGGMLQALDRSGSVFAARLVAEVERLERYAAHGDIRREQIPPSVRTAVRQLVVALQDTGAAI